MVATEEPMLSRLDRLDNILRHLEENRSVNARSSYESTDHSGGTTSDGHGASADTPRSLDNHCRSIEDVLAETQLKGTLIDRLHHVEDQLVKMCLQLETELDAAHKRADENGAAHHKRLGLKHLVKSCMRVKKRDKAHEAHEKSKLQPHLR